MKPSARMKPWLSITPLPALSQPLSVAVGMKAPVLPVHELGPASLSACTTPAVTSDWFDAAAMVIDLTRVLAATPVAAGQ